MYSLSLSKRVETFASHPQRVYNVVTKGTATLVFLVGLLTVLGWLLDIPVLKSIRPDGVSMNPITAFCFLLCAVALWFLLPFQTAQETGRVFRPRWIFLVCLLPVILIGLLRFSDYAIGTHFRLDRLLFTNSLGDNQMAPNTAVGFMTAGFALLLASWPESWHRNRWLIGLRTALLLALVSVSHLAIVGYILGADRLYHVTHYIPMALNTALCFWLLAIGSFCVFPHYEPIRTVFHASSGGASARRLLILAFGVPLMLGALRLEGEWRGYYSTETAAAFVATLTTGVFATVIWSEARRQQRLEQELHQANVVIRQNEQLFRAVLETLPVGIHVVDQTGKTTTRNPATEAIWAGKPRQKNTDEILQQGWWSDSGKAITTDEWPLARALSCGEITINAEIDILCSDGTRKTLLTSGIPIRDDQSQITGAIGVKQDITYRKETERALAESEAQVRRSNEELEQRVRERTSELEETHRALQAREEQLQQAQKLEVVGRLAGGIAHDFNNMLTAISVYTEMILWTQDLSEEVQNDLIEVQRTVQRATDLTRQLLAFSRKQVISPQHLDLRKTIHHIHAMLQRLIGEDIDLVTIPSSSPTPILADPGQIQQILTNLVVNARDAMPTGGQITVETIPVTLDATSANEYFRVEPGEYVMLAVSDTGQGMDVETRHHIFEPFFTTKAVGQGTGLGLSTVYGIVQQSKGHIQVYSEPGQGTVFKIYFPRVEGEAGVPVELPHQTLPVGSETILLIEDDAAVRSVTRSILEKSGYTVLEALTGEQALQIAERHPQPIDLLITDLVMPQMGGRELAERINLLHPDTPVLYMSGYTDDAVVRHGVLTAEMAFLQKPFTALQLSQKVRETLEG